jgi:hypothetical protein
MLTCWPRGLLDRHEAEALLALLRDREAKTVEEEMARDKLSAAVEATPRS